MDVTALVLFLLALFIGGVTTGLAGFAFALAIPPRTGAADAVPSGRLPGSVGSSIGRSPEPQRLVRPREAGIRVEEPTAPVARTQPDTVPLPRPSLRATLARTASPSPVEDSIRSAPERQVRAVQHRQASSQASAYWVRPAAHRRPSEVIGMAESDPIQTLGTSDDCKTAPAPPDRRRTISLTCSAVIVLND
jgi:hypothetical protein